jgi:hypothetical protein
MNRSRIRGIEVTKESDRLVIRNTWSVQTLGGHLLLVIGLGFFGCCGFMGLVPVEGESLSHRVIGTVLAAVGIPIAALCFLALPLHTIRHRRPFILDRQIDRFLDGRQEVCRLSDIRSLRIDECGYDPTDYAVRLVLADGRKLHTLEQRIDEFRQRAEAERLATEIADFLSVELAAEERGNQFDQSPCCRRGRG